MDSIQAAGTVNLKNELVIYNTIRFPRSGTYIQQAPLQRLSAILQTIGSH